MGIEIESIIEQLQKRKETLNQNTYNEALSRIDKIGVQYSKLMLLNTKYLSVDPVRMEFSFDEESGVMQFIPQGNIIFSIKLNRANPDVPIKLMGRSDASSFVSNEDLVSEGETDFNKLRNEISGELESFYFNASKLWDLVEKVICKKTKSEFIGVKMVRNKLIEHTEDGDIYSFGVSEEWGPSVKPSQLLSRKEKFHDKGLRVNAEELLEKIKLRLSK
jgi:hypothetical protein